MKHFNDKTVFLIGGSSGIGLSTANLLAGQGAHLVIFARDPDRLDRARREITGHRRSADQRVAARRLDVADARAVRQVITDAISEFGVPDALINCAGRAYPRPFQEITDDQFDETMKINLYGIWNTVSALAPHMKKKGGHIVNTASMAGLIGVYGYTDYCASKFGVIGFSEALRSELRPLGVRVSVLCPPDTDTPGFAVENRTKPPETQAVSAGAKLMTPDDVARALLAGMRRGRFLILPGFDSKLTFFVKRLLPGLVDRIMARAIRKAQRGRDAR